MTSEDIPAPRARRKVVSPKERFKIYERYGFRCGYCGTPAVEQRLHLDHFIPLCEGGPDEKSNLVPACPDCNLGKGRDQPVDVDETFRWRLFSCVHRFRAWDDREEAVCAALDAFLCGVDLFDIDAASSRCLDASGVRDALKPLYGPYD